MQNIKSLLIFQGLFLFGMVVKSIFAEGLSLIDGEVERFDLARSSVCAAKNSNWLNRYFEKERDIKNPGERKKFVLGAMRGGEVRIVQAQELVKKAGKNATNWAEVKDYLSKDIVEYVEKILFYEKEFAKKSKAGKKVEKASKATSIAVLDKEFDLNRETLSCFNSDSIAKAVRHYFDAYVEIKSKNPEAIRPHTVNGEAHRNLFTEKFIVLYAQGGHFGGYELAIAIAPKNIQPLWVWVYNIGNDKNEEWVVRAVEELALSPQIQKQLTQLKTEEYTSFWQ